MASHGRPGTAMAAPEAELITFPTFFRDIATARIRRARLVPGQSFFALATARAIARSSNTMATVTVLY
jgi:hypothetical protein